MPKKISPEFEEKQVKLVEDGASEVKRATKQTRAARATKQTRAARATKNTRAAR